MGRPRDPATREAIARRNESIRRAYAADPRPETKSLLAAKYRLKAHTVRVILAEATPNPKNTEISTLRAELAETRAALDSLRADIEEHLPTYAADAETEDEPASPEETVEHAGVEIRRLTRDLSATRERAERAERQRSEFAQHLIHLVQLHALIDEGKGDGNEAEAVRDKMDGPWARMTPEERKTVGTVGAALNALSARAVAAEAQLAAVRRTLTRWLAWHGDRDNLYDVDEIAAESRAALTDNGTPGEGIADEG